MGIHHHSHSTHEAAPVTEGRTIRWAQHYDAFVRLLTLGRENALRTETIQLAALPTGGSVLDVGCGTGTLTLRAKAAVGASGKVCGVDAAPEMVEVARQKAGTQQGVEFRVGLIEALPFADGTFDVVVSSLMFHHLPPAVKQKGLKEIYRVLKPGGRLLIVDMKPPTGLRQHVMMTIFMHHQLSEGVQDWLPAMREIGFTTIKTGSLRIKMLEFVDAQRS